VSRIDPVVGSGPREKSEQVGLPLRNPKAKGRPRKPELEAKFTPTEQDREVVKLLSGFMLPHERICRAVRNPHTRRPIWVPTLLRHFEHELEAGRAVVDALLANTLAKKLREGNIVAAIWCSKNLWGWTDRVEQSGRSAVDLTVKIDPADLARRLESRGLPPIMLGIDKPVLPELEARKDAVGHALINGKGNGASERDDG
jgi:hypothetical protein